MFVANQAVASVISTLSPKLCKGAMLQQIDWAIGVLAKEASELREQVKPDYQPRNK